MSASVEIYCGPARSGKTEALLAKHRAALVDGSPGRALWFAPNQRAAQDIRGRLLGGDLQACFAPGVMTFDQFAEAVLAASTTPSRRISDWMKRRLIDRLLRELIQQGEVRHFFPVAETPGFLDQLTGFISELKRLEIWPDEFLAAAGNRGLSDKDRELAALYAAYQDRLAARQLYDTQGGFWSARALLKAGQRRPFENVRMVVADGFTDFTRTQLEILEILATRVEQLLVSLPLEGGQRRPGLFAKPQQTLDRLLAVDSTARIVWFDRRPHPHWPAMAHLERELFAHPRHVRPAAVASGIEILSASSRRAELEWIARRAKQLLTLGDLQSPQVAVRPGDIAVVFRTLKDTADLVREVFDEFGLPYSIESGRQLSGSPPLAWLVALLRLDAEDWPYRRLLAVLSNQHLRPNWPEWQEGRAAEAAQWAIRALEIPAGREQLLRQLELAAQTTQSARGPEKPPVQTSGGSSLRQLRLPRTARQTLDLLTKLASVLDALPRQASATEWVEALGRLAEDTGLSRSLETEGRRPLPDRQAWDRLCEALLACDMLDRHLGDSPASLDRAELLKTIGDVLAGHSLPCHWDDIGRIRVLSASTARSLEAPFLFLAGLSEDSFPSRLHAGRLYGEAEELRLASAGLPVILRAERGQEEMLLFYEIVTRASRRLILSYPGLDERAQPLLPSSYLIELERAFEPGALPRQAEADLSPIPRDAEPASPVELRVRATADALAGDGALLAGLVRDDASGMADNLLAGLQLTDERSRRDALGAYEGILSSEEAIRALTARFGEEYVWSASQLEDYSYCPYRFLLSRVLGIEPLAELAVETDFLSRGGRLHELLALIHRMINAEHGRPTRWTGGSEAQFSRFIDEGLRRIAWHPASATPVAQGLAEIDRQVVRRWLQDYYRQQIKYEDSVDWKGWDEALSPAHFEASFGLAPLEEEMISSADPLLLQVGKATIRLAGRIDRVDVGRFQGQLVFVVIDYKSSLSKSAKKQLEEIQSGQALQLPLYALAAQRVLLLEHEAQPWQGGYWMVADKGFREMLALGEPSQVTQPASIPAWGNLTDRVSRRAMSLVQGIRQGEFPVVSADDECTSRCPFRTVCRVNQVRALEKTWQPPRLDAD